MQLYRLRAQLEEFGRLASLVVNIIVTQGATCEGSMF
jgi:hypothetical protein